MGDFYLDDQLFDHPKALAAGEDATNLYVRILAWAHRHNTGHIPKLALQSLTTKKAGAMAKALLAAGLLEDGPSHYEIHDWYDRNQRMQARRSQAKAAAEHRWRNAKSNATAYANAPPGALQTAVLDGMPDGCDRNAQAMPNDKDKDLSKSHQLTEDAKDPPGEHPDDAIIDQALGVIADRRLATNGQVRNRGAYRKTIIGNLRAEHAIRLAVDVPVLLQGLRDQSSGFDPTAEWLADFIEPAPVDTTRRDYATPRPDCQRCGGSGLILDDNDTAHPCNHEPAPVNPASQ